MNTTFLRHDITGLILAGGQGRRMGSVDKGLLLLGHRTLTAHVIERLRPQVGTLLINANRNLARYAAFGYPVISDTFSDFPGPLAGLHAGLSEARTPWVVTAPCDSPMLPRNLVARLYAAAQQHDAPLAAAKTGDRLHSVFALAHRRALPDLTAFLQGGDRKVALWFARVGGVEVSFDDQPDAFRNINTQNELDALRQCLPSLQETFS
ncbi:MAG: molybdenum cofactor guanylyltransferase [Burkholderiales bacterium]|jgi:molybdopterin-guanine dinucleotide biosynthesis protein A|nr:molybdenum cofactor guanylyltransferase [Burkholderiales bacterium]